MKCIFMIPRMGGGGAERVVSLLANALVEDENDVTIFTLVGGESFYELDSRICYENVGVTVNRKNRFSALWSQLKFFPKSFFSFRRKLLEGKYDVVIPMLPECDILVGLCKLSGVKFRYICSERNDPNRRKKVLLTILKQIYKKASLFICQGQKVYDFYNEVPNKNKIIISNPVNGDLLPDRANVYSKRVVGVGRLNSQKNFSLLIDSFAKLDERFLEYKLDIYGEGPEREALQRQIDLLHIQDRVVLRGAKKNVQQLIADADLYVMSSDYEGFPNALLEAMAVGLPVISTDFATGIAADLIGKDNGIIVPVGDREALTNAITSLLLDETRRRQIGANNREICKKFYTPQIVAKWKKALEYVCENR